MASLQLGNPTQFGNMTVFPIFLDVQQSPSSVVNNKKMQSLIISEIPPDDKSLLLYALHSFLSQIDKKHFKRLDPIKLAKEILTEIEKKIQQVDSTCQNTFSVNSLIQAWQEVVAGYEISSTSNNRELTNSFELIYEAIKKTIPDVQFDSSKTLYIIAEAIYQAHQGMSMSAVDVTNDKDYPILITKGEELVGGMQNRISSATVLIKGHSKVRVPVYCSEQNQWRVDKKQLDIGDFMLPYHLRVRSLEQESEKFSERQEAIWDDLQGIHQQLGGASQNANLKSIYRSKLTEPHKYLEVFKFLPGQNGLCVAINGLVAGIDSYSCHKTYASMHAKLISSFALSALLLKSKSDTQRVTSDDIQAFFETAQTCIETKRSSIGEGSSYSFVGEDFMGTALVSDNKVLHVSFLNRVSL